MNLFELIESHTRNRPSHPAVIDGARVLVYRDFRGLVLAAAARLTAAGVGQGDVVGVKIEDATDHLVVLYALARIGAIVLPIEDTFAAAERERTLSTFGAQYLVARRAVQPIDGIVVILTDESWREATRSTPELPPTPADVDLPFLIALTSGSTGAPKGVLLSHEQQWLRAVSYAVNHGVCALDRYLSVLRVSLNVGRNCALAQTLFGGTVIVNHAATVAGLQRDIDRHRATWTFLLPADLRQLAEIAKQRGPLLPELRLLMTGTGPLHGAEQRAVIERVTPRLCVTYGANDSGRFSQLDPVEALGHPDSVGLPLVGVEAQVVDDDHRPLPAGRLGQIRLRGPGFPTGYHRNPEATARSYRDGFFYPGDVAVIDADGYIFLKGRTDDVINFKGLKIHPPDVETVLSAHPGVTEAAVIGWQHGNEEVPVGFVVTRAAIDEAELKAFARQRLAAHKVPIRILRLADLPKTTAGKTDRAALKRLVKQTIEEHQRP